jgi:ribonuclease HI
MSSAFLESIEILKDFSQKIQVLRSSVQSECEDMKQEVYRHISQSRIAMQNREAELADAIEALNNVPEGENDDYEQETVEDAQVVLRQTRGRMQKIEEAGHQFIAVLAKETSALNGAFRSSHAFIEERIETGAQYRSLSQVKVQTGVPATRKTGISSPSSSAPRPANHPTSESISEALPPLPRKMQWVPISEIDESAIPEVMEFKKAPYDEMYAMMETFEKNVLPLLKNDPSLTAYDFPETGPGKASMRTASPRFAYECMLGSLGTSDVIAVDARSNNELSKRGITSGRHRIKVAKELGWTYVPARILGGSHA